MNLVDIASARLINQKIGQTANWKAEDIVQWMGAIQSQDYAMSLWAIGIRLGNSTSKQIQNVIDKGIIIRTHVLRPTWHLIPSADIYWMLDLTAPRIKAQIKTRQRSLGLTAEILNKTYSIIEKELSGNRHLTREELILHFNNANIATNENRASQIFVSAELDGLICSGPLIKNKQSFTLLEERVPNKIRLSKEESLKKLAEIYFKSHGPATIKDFAWWSGLSLTEARNGQNAIQALLTKSVVDNKEYWCSNPSSISANIDPSVHLLPAFDEYLISYTDRSATIPTHYQKMTFTSNGIFKPIIVINGQVVGIWKRTIKKDKIILETQFIKALTKKNKLLIDKAVLDFGHFLERKIEVIHQLV